MKINFLLKHPYLFFVIAAIIISNNTMRYAPGALEGKMAYIVPAIITAFGVMAYVIKAKEKTN